MNKKVERRFFGTELRFSTEGILSGHAAVFNKWSEQMGFFKEQIAPGAFRKTIQEADVRALFNHDPNYPLGRTTNGTLKLWEDDVGLAYELQLPNTSYAKDLRESIKRGDVTQNSIGMVVVKEKWSTDGKKRTLLEVRLYDVSPVTFPAYPQTDVSARAAVSSFSPMRLLRARMAIAQRLLSKHSSSAPTG